MNNSISWWIRRHAEMRPERIALVAPERRLTYARLHTRANQAAHLLAEQLHLAAGDRLAILAVNCLEWFELFVAAARLGVVVVPLNVRLTPPELRYQLQDAGCTALAATEEFWPTLPQLLPETPVAHLLAIPAPGSENRCTASIPTLHYEEALAGCPASAVAETATDDAPLLIVYTSGTTGKPKGAILTHGNLLYNALNNTVGLGLTAADVVLTVLPLFHVGGIGLFATPVLYTGGRVVLPRRFDPVESLRLIEQERVTVTMTVPTIMQAYLDALAQLEPAPDLSSCRAFVSGGAPCPTELTAAVAERGLPYSQGYGMTETAPSVFLQPELQEAGTDSPTEVRPFRHIGKPGTIGKSVLFADVQLLDDEGKPVGVGEVGEICVRGGNVFAGYWNRPEATLAAFTPDGYFRSGDLARIDSEGYVTIMGRRKEMLISGGENVYPLEVEQVLASHPAVADVAVVGVPDPRWGEVPGAGIVLRPGQQATAGELTAWCRQSLAGYKTPKRWLFLTDLPRTAIGKVIKPELARRLQEESV